ncbi:MAG: hypothetical protein D6725_12405 [Planctomycetota bacterium]|nr:MAG: hypothetical protein D6725_12405 [Planctomycetota bacterium]
MPNDPPNAGSEAPAETPPATPTGDAPIHAASRTDTEPTRADERELLRQAQAGGLWTKLKIYTRLSGPGWLQSAITLGGGSLASSLYLGVLAGFSLLWLQPLAMVFGIIMLSAIGYVTLSTGERPFRAINEHVSPVLGWSWALAVAAANIVWCLPQYSLAFGVLSQNLLPGVFGANGVILKAAAETADNGWLAANAHKLVASGLILIVVSVITWSYDRGGRGIKLYEMMLKSLVGLIVVCFIGVVGVLAVKGERIDWSAVARGLIPDFSALFHPAPTFEPILQKLSAASAGAREFWEQLIVARQRDVMISAAATAVGINMTFLFPYSLLKRGWGREHRGLAIFDLSTGMFVPYVLATGCVVLAAAAQFHTQLPEGCVIDERTGDVVIPDKFRKGFDAMLEQRETYFAERGGDADVPPPSLEEKQLAAMLVTRDAMDLAQSLQPLTGPVVANVIFGLGVLAMTLSTISLLMLISGFVVCEMLAVPIGGTTHKLGMLLAAVGGALGPFVWNKASFYLAVPTSVFGFVLLPFAYVTFLLLLNQSSLLGDDCPRGLRRLGWNLLAGTAAAIATVGSFYMIWVKAGYGGVAAAVGLVLLTLLVAAHRRNAAIYRLD